MDVGFVANVSPVGLPVVTTKFDGGLLYVLTRAVNRVIFGCGGHLRKLCAGNVQFF